MQVDSFKARRVERVLPWWLSGKASACNAGGTGDMGSSPGSGRSPEEERATRASILAWKILWTRSQAGYSPWGHKESDTTEHIHI